MSALATTNKKRVARLKSLKRPSIGLKGVCMQMAPGQSLIRSSIRSAASASSEASSLFEGSLRRLGSRRSFTAPSFLRQHDSAWVVPEEDDPHADDAMNQRLRRLEEEFSARQHHAPAAQKRSGTLKGINSFFRKVAPFMAAAQLMTGANDLVEAVGPALQALPQCAEHVVHHDMAASGGMSMLQAPDVKATIKRSLQSHVSFDIQSAGQALASMCTAATCAADSALSHEEEDEDAKEQAAAQAADAEYVAKHAHGARRSAARSLSKMYVSFLTRGGGSTGEV